MAQQATSANTSINSKRLPAIYNKLYISTGRVIDYGCGKYTDHIRWYLYAHQYLPYDPFNQPDEVNRKTLETCKDRHKATVILSNVLNVIDDMQTVFDVIDHCLELAHGGSVCVTVYEGDKSGVGKYTKKDCFQRNWKFAQWVQWLIACGYLICWDKGIIFIEGKQKRPFRER